MCFRRHRLQRFVYNQRHTTNCALTISNDSDSVTKRFHPYRLLSSLSKSCPAHSFLYTESISCLFRLFVYDERTLSHYLSTYTVYNIKAKTVIIMKEYRLFSCMLYQDTNTLNQTEHFIVGENVSPDSVRTLTLPRVHN